MWYFPLVGSYQYENQYEIFQILGFWTFGLGLACNLISLLSPCWGWRWEDELWATWSFREISQFPGPQEWMKRQWEAASYILSIHAPTKSDLSPSSGHCSYKNPSPPPFRSGGDFSTVLFPVFPNRRDTELIIWFSDPKSHGHCWFRSNTQGAPYRKYKPCPLNIRGSRHLLIVQGGHV
jgi:hypothetical protein